MATKPLLRDFIGLNTHTVQFRPDLYKPVTRLLRDYHGLNWDVGEETPQPPTFPMSRNGVNWEELYGKWVRAGYEINASIMLGRTPPDAWKDMRREAFEYGKAFARFFGPSSRNLVAAAEIGNEPGHYPDPAYRAIFESMAKGFREGDPRLKVVTCAMFDRPSGKYHKALSCVKGLNDLYDVVNLHSYAQIEPYPTWRRTYPEDPKCPYAEEIGGVIAWRDANAKGKPVWLTEFGYDSTTKPNEKTGDFKNWVGVTDIEQARYIVRSFLVFSAMDLDRAYLYWFNDEDKPSVHAAAGLTRHFQPKPSFHAVAHLLSTLGPYRFARVVRAERNDVYVYEYQHGTDRSRRVWVAWSPTGKDRKAFAQLTDVPGKPERVERMPLSAGGPEKVGVEAPRPGVLRVPIDESPVYIVLRTA